MILDISNDLLEIPKIPLERIFSFHWISAVWSTVDLDDGSQLFLKSVNIFENFEKFCFT